MVRSLVEFIVHSAYDVWHTKPMLSVFRNIDTCLKIHAYISCTHAHAHTHIHTDSGIRRLHMIYTHMGTNNTQRRYFRIVRI